MSPFTEKRYNIFDVAEREGVDVSTVLDWCKRGLRNTPNLADGSIEIAASDLREFLDRRKADVTPTTESDNTAPPKPAWHAHGRLTPGEVAEWQGVSRETVEQWIQDGLQCEQLERIRLIWRGDVKKFLAARETQTPDTSGGTTRSESATGESIIVAEEFNHGFFG